MSMANYDWAAMSQKLIMDLRLQTNPIGIKLFKNKEELNTINKIRIPQEGMRFNACQLFGQAARLNFTVGFSAENLLTDQCGSVFGMKPRDVHVTRTSFAGVWYDTPENAMKHQRSMYTIPEEYQAVAIAPLAGGRIAEPDVCGIYCTPQQLCFISCALQFYNYEPLEMSFVGESSCSDAWAKAFITGKPSVTIPCYGERRYGGVQDNEMLIAFPPSYMEVILKGLDELSKRGLRYPISYYGIQNDAGAGMAKNYGKR